MSESYEQLLTAARDRRAWVFLDLQPPRDAPDRRFRASLFASTSGGERPPRPEGQAVTVAVTLEQARALLAAGAEWNGPSHLRHVLTDP